MLIKFSDYLSVDDGIDVSKTFTINPLPLESKPNVLPTPEYKTWLPHLENEKKIFIQGAEYHVVSAPKFYRHKGSDGRYHAIYIQIDYNSGEYYIGKVNRQNWREVKNYAGSGVVFKAKYKKHSERYARYYLFVCDSEKETEELEAKIVNRELLNDPFCLNKIQGGGGVSNVPYTKERKARQSQYMKEHPERYEAMIQATRNFDEEKIRQRSQKIKEKMSSDYYREMSRERINNWKERDPEGYKAAREKNRISVNKPESKKKRSETLKRWKTEHPKETRIWEEHRREALNSPESRQHRSEKQKDWIASNPEKAQQRKEKAKKSFIEKYAKPVAMLDLKTKQQLKTFYIIKEAANWLLQNGYTKSINPSSQIVAVCMKKQIPGHGIKKSAYGFDWEYIGR